MAGGSGKGPALVIRRSCLWIINFSIQWGERGATLPAFFPPSTFKERATRTGKRYKDVVGKSARQIAVQSGAAVLWRRLSVRRYSTTCSHRTATAAAALTSL